MASVAARASSWCESKELTMTKASPNKLVFTLDRLEVAIGTMLVVTDPDGRLRALDWADCESRMHRLLRLHYGVVELIGGRMPERVRDLLEGYFRGAVTGIDALPVATGGTEFQQQVWAALRAIPAGETRSYGALAKAIGRPSAVRAVGLANGANPIGVVVPCHRVIGQSGALTGYAGGLERKRWLLAHESAG
jgi:methylated-DNA-[protein]-cysteine S-methyltransferase